MTYQVPEKKMVEYRAAYAAERGRVRTIEHLKREVELLTTRLRLTEQLMLCVNEYNIWAQAQLQRLNNRLAGNEEASEFLQLSEYILANQDLARRIEELEAGNRKLQAARDKYHGLFREGVANRRNLVGHLRALASDKETLEEEVDGLNNELIILREKWLHAWQQRQLGAPPPVEVTVFGAQEWYDAVNKELDALGVTFEQLKAMSDAGDFETLNHKKLWYSIGGQKPEKPDAPIAEEVSSMQSL